MTQSSKLYMIRYRTDFNMGASRGHSIGLVLVMLWCALSLLEFSIVESFPALCPTLLPSFVQPSRYILSTFVSNTVHH